MRSNNPVLTRLVPPGYGRGAAGYAPQPSPGTSYPSPVIPTTTDRMTVDDVVVRTVGLLALTIVSAAAAWIMVPDRYLGTVWIGSAIVGVVIGLAIAFARLTNPVVLALYAVVEGVFLGVVSKAYESLYGGIVLQAVLGTVGVFFVMSMLYKSRAIRATPRFNRIVTGCLVGASVVVLGNFALYLFGVNTVLNGNGPIALVFVLGLIVLGALSFVQDFDQIERGVQAGLPKQYAWTCAFGLLVGLIWMYIWILRFLGIMRSN